MRASANGGSELVENQNYSEILGFIELIEGHEGLVPGAIPGLKAGPGASKNGWWVGPCRYRCANAGRHVRHSLMASWKSIQIFWCAFTRLATRQLAVLLITAVSVNTVHAQARWSSAANTERTSMAPLCRALVDRLNSIKPSCERDALGTYPGFSNPPWRALDAKKHLDLIAKLIAVAQGAAPKYVEQSLTAQQLAARRVLAEQFIKSGGRAMIWHARVLSHFGPDLEKPTPPGDQTLIVMITDTHFFSAETHASCPGVYSKGWLTQTFVVSPDLSGPDPRVDGPIAAKLVSSRPVIYRGKALLIRDQFPFVFKYRGPIFIDSVYPGGGVCYLTSH